MEIRSLTLAKENILKVLKDDYRIPQADRLELIINLWLYLNENKYEDNNKVLNKELRYDKTYNRKK